MDTDDHLVGKQLGNYRIERLLGTGGMGSVYRAWDTGLDRPVAVKIMAEHVRRSPALAAVIFRPIMYQGFAANMYQEFSANMYH